MDDCMNVIRANTRACVLPNNLDCIAFIATGAEFDATRSCYEPRSRPASILYTGCPSVFAATVSAKRAPESSCTNDRWKPITVAANNH